MIRVIPPSWSRTARTQILPHCVFRESEWLKPALDAPWWLAEWVIRVSVTKLLCVWSSMTVACTVTVLDDDLSFLFTCSWALLSSLWAVGEAHLGEVTVLLIGCDRQDVYLITVTSGEYCRDAVRTKQDEHKLQSAIEVIMGCFHLKERT